MIDRVVGVFIYPSASSNIYFDVALVGRPPNYAPKYPA